MEDCESNDTDLDDIFKQLDDIFKQLNRVIKLLEQIPDQIFQKQPEPVSRDVNTLKMSKRRVFMENTEDLVAIPDFSDTLLVEFFRRASIKVTSQRLWLETYRDAEWLKLEFHKMLSWLDANPHKKPKKNYARFVTSWLSRAWEYHRKQLPSNKPTQINWDNFTGE
jgi:hypothetical protein